MNKLSFFIALYFSINCSIAQECICPKNDYLLTEIDTIYTFNNGNKIVLSGFRNDDETFSEFMLSDCKTNNIIGFWGAVETCEIYQKDNKLIVEELYALPIKSNEYEIIVWTYIEISFEKDSINKKIYLNETLPKYSEKEIDLNINKYKKSKNKLDNNCIILANKLFISAISGSQEARRCFIEFPNKFIGLDGAFLEEYNDLVAMLNNWDNNQKIK